MIVSGYQIHDDVLAAVDAKIAVGQHIFPPVEMRFKALELTPLDQVKVVVLGQDPYHGQGQAHGLSFSVPKGVKLPPSLKNVFKEIVAETGGEIPISGDLTYLAKQGVLLLNSVLSVEASKPASHAGLGWEEVTDSIISQISEKREHVVFLLWGAYAAKKEKLINSKQHLVLKSPHPSPFSAHKGFFGNGHFQKSNDYLTEYGLNPIQWLNL